MESPRGWVITREVDIFNSYNKYNTKGVKYEKDM
nr:MAG TPA: hypothetical protein [Caudoviricetes sp.]